MIDRCKQTLVKLALEPEWEAKFEPQSDGFRPERGTHDAIAAISQAIKHQPVFVFEADIEGAFDNVRHDVVLNKLNTYPALRQALAVWLKAGVMDGDISCPTEKGLPQGSGLSPLLLNVALHGMATVVAPGGPSNAHKGERPLLVRYADDIVLLHSHLQELQQAIQRVTQWLAIMGLHFHPRKTHISHTLIPFQGNVGFDFLGFTLRQIAISKTPTFQTVLTPTDEAKRRHFTTIEHRLHQLQTASQAQVIKERNPLIGGWAAYYKGVTSLAQYDDLLWHMLIHWAKQRHPNQERRWLLHCYWRRIGQQWVFATPEGTHLRTYS